MLFLMKYFTFHQFSSLHYIFIKIQHNNYLLCEVLKIIACVLPKELFFFFCWCYFASWGSVLNPSNSLVMDGFSCKDVEDWNTNDSLSLPFPFFPFPCMDWHRMVLITLMWVRCLVFDLPLFFSSGHQAALCQVFLLQGLMCCLQFVINALIEIFSNAVSLLIVHWSKTHFVFSGSRFKSLLLKIQAFTWLFNKGKNGFSIFRITHVVFV